MFLPAFVKCITIVLLDCKKVSIQYIYNLKKRLENYQCNNIR